MNEIDIIETLRQVDLAPENQGVSATCTLCGSRLRRYDEHGTLGDFVEAMLQHMRGNHPADD